MVTAELPGCNVEDVEDVARGRILTIRGAREIKEMSRGEHDRRLERSYGDVGRSFPPPDGITKNDIDAKVAYGVVQIKIKHPEIAPAPGSPSLGPVTQGAGADQWPVRGRPGALDHPDHRLSGGVRCRNLRGLGRWAWCPVIGTRKAAQQCHQLLDLRGGKALGKERDETRQMGLGGTP